MTDNTTSRQPEFTTLLHHVYDRLVQVERTIDALVDRTPDGIIIWGFPQTDAAQARDILRLAPSLEPRSEPALDPAAADATADALATQAAEIRRTLISASLKATDPDDKHACLSAAVFVGRLHEALR